VFFNADLNWFWCSPRSLWLSDVWIAWIVACFGACSFLS
jgi:hypothetical protein